MAEFVWILYFIGITTKVFVVGQEERIILGEDTDIREARFYALFTCNNKACGATLVTTTKLITAAHCVIDCPTKYVKFYMGMNSRSEIYDGVANRYDAISIYLHPKYKETKSSNYDIAVVYVDGEVTINDRVEPISYTNSKPPLNDSVACFGYGLTDDGQKAKMLQRAEFLTKRYEHNRLIVNADHTAFSPGDSGGPCIYGNKLAAVIVGGYNNTSEHIAVMTATDDVLNFIRSNSQRICGNYITIFALFTLSASML